MVREPIIEIDIDELIKRYLNNPITKAIVFGGLEPLFENYFKDVYTFIDKLRNTYNCNDKVVIYTGYYEDEKKEEIIKLSKFNNIIVKFGRYIPNHEPHFDEVLGINLASDNQYAKEL